VRKVIQHSRRKARKIIIVIADIREFFIK